MNTYFYIITFDSTHKAIRTDKNLKEVMKGELIPTPREISASCGLSFKFSPDDRELAYLELTKKPNLLDGLVLYSMEKNLDHRKVMLLEWTSGEEIKQIWPR